MQDEGGDLVPRGDDAGHRPVLAFVDQLLGQQDEAVGVLVVGHAEGADDPFGFDGLDQVEVEGKGARRRKVGEQGAEIADEGGDLGLLQLQGDELGAAAGLEVEHALAGRPDRPRGEVIDLVQVIRLVHEAASVLRSPVEFTVRVIGEESP